MVWDEPGIKSYMIDISGELSLHHDFTGPWTREYIARLHTLFESLCLCLMDRGMEYVDTWITEGDDVNYDFVQKFGFVDTNILKKVRVGETEFLFRVMRHKLPTFDQLFEGVRD